MSDNVKQTREYPCIEQVQYAAYPNVNNACKRGEQMGVQVVASLVIVIWTVTTTGLVFVLTNYIIGMRVDVFLEEDGLDRSVHNTNLTRKDMDKTPGSSQQELEQPAPPFPQQ